jgi:hypothetical protein
VSPTFRTITAADWQRSLVAARRRRIERERTTAAFLAAHRRVVAGASYPRLPVVSDEALVAPLRSGKPDTQ